MNVSICWEKKPSGSAKNCWRQKNTKARNSSNYGTVLSPWPFLQGTLSFGYLMVVLPADLLFAWTIVVLFRQPRGAATTAKVAMLAVLGAFLVGVCT